MTKEKRFDDGWDQKDYGASRFLLTKKAERICAATGKTFPTLSANGSDVVEDCEILMAFIGEGNTISAKQTNLTERRKELLVKAAGISKKTGRKLPDHEDDDAKMIATLNDFIGGDGKGESESKAPSGSADDEKKLTATERALAAKGLTLEGLNPKPKQAEFKGATAKAMATRAKS